MSYQILHFLIDLNLCLIMKNKMINNIDYKNVLLKYELWYYWMCRYRMI